MKKATLLETVVLGLAVVLAAAPLAQAQGPRPGGTGKPMMKPKDLAALKAELVKQHGEASRARIERGIDQVAALWRKADGSEADFKAFVREHFLADPRELDRVFARFQTNFEQLDGHLLEIARELRAPLRPGRGAAAEGRPAVRGATIPSAHMIEDLFRNKLGFVVLLNFPLTTLKDKLEQGKGFSRRAWAETRLAGRFGRRVPAEVQQDIAAAAAAAELYISEYNIWMHHLLDDNGQRLFPKGLRLISHWNLRDELKGNYADSKVGLAKQRMILRVMERIVTQTIPQVVIDNPRVDWNPVTNQVTPAPAGAIEDNAPRPSGKPEPKPDVPEPDVRYSKLLGQLPGRAQGRPLLAGGAHPDRPGLRPGGRDAGGAGQGAADGGARLTAGARGGGGGGEEARAQARAARPVVQRLRGPGQDPRARARRQDAGPLPQRRRPSPRTCPASSRTWASPRTGPGTWRRTSSSIRRAGRGTPCRRRGGATSPTCAPGSRRTA